MGQAHSPVTDGWAPTLDGSAALVSLTATLASRERPAWEQLGLCAARLAELFGDTLILSLLSDDGRWLHPLGIAAPEREATCVLESLAGARLRADRGFSRQVLQTGRPLRLLVTSAAIVSAGRPELATYAERFEPRALLIVPIRARGRVIGSLAAFRLRDEPFDGDDERLAQSVADLAGLAVAGGGPPSQRLSARRESGLPEDLSDREREVLTLLALGHTNREIAEQLVLSVRTVEWHRARIQWKLGVSGRAALAKAARGSGLID